MMRTKKNITGYVLPVAMALMSVLTFSMLGVMESATVEKKKSSNQKVQLTVEQVARSELDSQLQLIESKRDLLRKAKSYVLTPILYPNGCASTAIDAICQTVKLVYTSDLPRPAGLFALEDDDQYVARKFKIYSKAQHIKSGAVSEVYSEIRDVRLELWAPDNVRDKFLTSENRDELMAEIGLYLPDWWEVKVVVAPKAWRFACIAATNSILNFFPGILIAALSNILSKGFMTEGSCTAQYTTTEGKTAYVSTPNFGGGGSWILEVPKRSTNVKLYWHAWVVPGSAREDCSWFECLIPGWRRIKRWDFEYNVDGRSPDPINKCMVISGGFWGLEMDACPYDWARANIENKKVGEGN
ncbi:MAG: hypothetical protein QS748_14425 [Candidatus Endonucleobacter bathymodioli]|uniref:Uncharacterized protein n=1 Tax=Candidatus Endonucleibacter bathymodioli TaxID=539814 RepID=A0AA90SU43_9GAMM|nr:hypothetical protein [Candidatus Endonucleobacter bathymodioli]